MEKNIRYTLGKTERLKSRKSIELLFKEGKSLAIYPFRILYQFKEAAPGLVINLETYTPPILQAGFTVSSRHFKRAVDRNRIKRLMREAYRLQKIELMLLPELQKYYLEVFIIYTGKEVPAYKIVFEKTAAILNRLIRITSEKK